MGVLVDLPIDTGETRRIYVRLNNFDQVANHGVPATARFRGFICRDAYESGGRFVFERVVEFDADVSQPLWAQAYAALRREPDFAEATDEMAS
ncbi:hypothetical protein [Sphingomonas sp. NIC1]|uniref:hypothetical protein n=1 Tax=Sphingomonas sp. NIC1 TaxID=1961362 RepID=UPI0007C0CEF7|nr:hypothetical protein [Sphingomonas sp. NIC1]ANC85473.1 hypothetical protein A7E77_00300 [Sphingomonas sp. NIC1]